MTHLTAVPRQDRIRVFVADSNAMSTQLLVDALGREPQLQVVEAATSRASILPIIKRDEPHIALISTKTGDDGHSAFDLVRDIRSQVPTTRVIMLLDSSERKAVVEAFRSGAQGVFCRTESLHLLSRCIQCVHSGQVWANTQQLHFVLKALAQPAFANFRCSGGTMLSARETDVVRCVAEGLSNREIAQRLNLTEHTVKNYLFRIFDKLGASSRVEVVLYALGNAQQTTTSLPTTRHAMTISNNARPLPVTLRKPAS